MSSLLTRRRDISFTEFYESPLWRRQDPSALHQRGGDPPNGYSHVRCPDTGQEACDRTETGRTAAGTQTELVTALASSHQDFPQSDADLQRVAVEDLDGTIQQGGSQQPVVRRELHTQDVLLQLESAGVLECQTPAGHKHRMM